MSLPSRGLQELRFAETQDPYLPSDRPQDLEFQPSQSQQMQLSYHEKVEKSREKSMRRLPVADAQVSIDEEELIKSLKKTREPS